MTDKKDCLCFEARKDRMKFTINRKKFAHALALAEETCAKKTLISILENAMITVKKDGCVLVTASDLHETVTTEITEAKVITEGIFAFDSKMAANAVAGLDSDEVTVSVDDKNAMITGGTATYKIAIVNYLDFPKLSEPTLEKFIEVDAAALNIAIGRVAWSIANSTRPMINCLSVVADGKKLSTAATNGHSLALTDVPFSATIKECLVSPSFAAKAIKAIDSIEKCGIYTSTSATDSMIHLKAGHITISSKLFDSTFPPVEQMVPKPSDTPATFDRTALLVALKRATSMRTEGDLGTLIFQKGKMHIDIKVTTCEGSDVVDCEGGNTLTLGMNLRYLRSAVEAFASDKIIIHFGSNLDPILLVDKDETQRTVIMPVLL
jgi:DNA polymerase-3 subunit beta